MLIEFFTNKPTQYDDEYVVVNKRAKVAKVLFVVILAILIYIFFWFPNYGGNLRFKIGSVVNWLINFLGTFLASLGTIFFVWGVLSVFISKGKSGVKMMITGFLFMMVGAVILGGIFPTGGSYDGITQGYH